jgi:hypothetical protein
MTESPADTRCRAWDLRLGFGPRFSEPTGQHSLALTLTNASGSRCTLVGYPEVILLDGQGRALPFAHRTSGDQVVTPHPPRLVVLARDGTAFVTINIYRCDLGDQQVLSIVRLLLLDDPSPLEVAGGNNLTYCGPGDHGSTISISPFGATLGETLADGA